MSFNQLYYLELQLSNRSIIKHFMECLYRWKLFQTEKVPVSLALQISFSYFVPILIWYCTSYQKWFGMCILPPKTIIFYFWTLESECHSHSVFQSYLPIKIKSPSFVMFQILYLFCNKDHYISNPIYTYVYIKLNFVCDSSHLVSCTLKCIRCCVNINKILKFCVLFCCSIYQSPCSVWIPADENLHNPVAHSLDKYRSGSFLSNYWSPALSLMPIWATKSI